MNSLKSLELQRLIKELQFVESDYLYQSEIVRQSNQYFLESVDFMLDSNPDLKKIWMEKKLQESQVSVQDLPTSIEKSKLDVDNKVKKIYREIVKSTHPDKIKNSKLNELYLEATFAYESNDIVTLYKVCSDLMIDFKFEDSEIDTIRNRILEIKSKILFLESTYTFKWLKSTETERNQVIFRFIEERLK